MITKQQYDDAVEQAKIAQETMTQFHRQEAEAFDQRLKSGVPFTDEELRYAATSLCPCGHGLAYPKDCGPNHYWDCSAILKGVADSSITHSGQLPFTFYDVKSESEERGTTRGVFRPKP
jgi:hypothetical protein